jgi:hypothetical protein
MVACDVVEALIWSNRRNYHELDVDFRVLDMLTDELPTGDVVLVRQVFQHLTNEQISVGLGRLVARFDRIIVTEHIPDGANFPSNLDKPIGPDTRLVIGSGVVLSNPPFSWRPRESRVLCEFERDGGIIRTVAHLCR